MSDDYVRVSPDGTGKKVDTGLLTNANGDQVERQAVYIGDPSDHTGQAVVTDATPSSSAYGLVTRPLLPAGLAQDGTDGTGINPPAGATGIRGWLSAIFQKLSGTLSVSASSWPLPTNAAQDGTDPTGESPDSGGVGIRGWLGTIATKLKGTLTVDASGHTVPVSGTFWQATQPVSGTVSVGNTPAVTDEYTTGEVLADQSGAGAVLTFTFANPRNLVWVRSDGAVSRADPFGGTPSATAGIYCDDGIPQPITVNTTTVKVYAPSGATVHVWGYSYA